MTLGEKITRLRNRFGISQEQLAEKTGVSRQSVSKWEMDSALPQIDKIMLLCELFHVSADALLKENSSLPNIENDKKTKNRYFGTDGFRGEANVQLTSMQAYKVGRFLGWYYSSEISGNTKPFQRPRIIIGKDTRRSSYMLEYSIAAGITASGADAYMLHVTTTPSVSYATRIDSFDCGIMITASHNIFYDNGIKIINRHGEKLEDRVTDLIEDYLDGNLEALGLKGDDLPLALRDQIGCIVDHAAGRNRYVGYLISLASHSYKDLRIGLDSSNGASWMIAKAVFDALGAKTYVIGAEPNGLNVNKDCGSTHIEKLSELVKNEHLDFGFAFDGDCDRCIAVDENGAVVDGDKIMYILAKRMKNRGMLNSNTLVATVMSNSGLKRSLKKEGIHVVETKVGDRFVYEAMQKGDYSLGGEQSGHIILKKYATTGDGLLTAIMITEEICDQKIGLSKLCDSVMLYPQHTKNIKVKSKEDAANDSDVLEELKKIEAEIGGNGRILLRKSGTEPVVRIMAEAQTSQQCKEYCARMESILKRKGHCDDKKS